MSFSNKFGIVRRIGRIMVLPVGKIKDKVTKYVFPKGVIIDFGAGTMYWSKWLYETYGEAVYAVDLFFEDGHRVDGTDIIQRNDFFQCADESEGAMLWMFDLLHHLKRKDREHVKNVIIKKKYSWVVIKDIDCRKRLGNFMNRLHDRIINSERVSDVDPEQIIKFLRNNHYLCKYYAIPKLWYPHFLILAKKKNE